MTNYRPVSVLLSLSKVSEKLYHSRIYDHLRNQYGFRRGNSIDLALISIINKICKAWENRSIVLSIVMDLSKASDTLSHTILPSKLDSCGISGPAFQWLKSYLSNRPQITKIDHTNSDSKIISCRVFQRSILSLLLFLVYINNITIIVSRSRLIHTDYCMCLITSKSYTQAIQIANSERKALSNWFNRNKLWLILSKTKAIIINKSTRSKASMDSISISIQGTTIKIIDHIKLLGVEFSYKFTWGPHIANVASRISCAIAILCRSRHTEFQMDGDSMMHTSFHTLTIVILSGAIRLR